MRSAALPLRPPLLQAGVPRRAVQVPVSAFTCRRPPVPAAFGPVRRSNTVGCRDVTAASSGSSTAPGLTSGEPSYSSSAPQKPPEPPTDKGVELTAYHYMMFFIMLGGGLLFLALLLYFTGDLNFQRAVQKVVKRLMKTVALRQVVGILSAMAFVRYGLEPVIKQIRVLMKAQGTWEKSSEYYILRELYKPLEFLFLVAAFTTLAENFLPQLIAIPKSIVQTVVRSTLSLTFVISACRVVFNIKARVIRETAWQMELKGDVTRQRRLEAIDKLLSVLTLIVGGVFGLQALGLDVNSVLAIGGVGGLAVGLAGREILENLFTGLIILSSNPFEIGDKVRLLLPKTSEIRKVGDEVLFRPSSGQVVEGIVLDVGWYRTTIRSFEREHFLIPNSVFSRNVVLNITRKQREWRFYEFVGLRIEDLPKVTAVVSDIRKIVKQDARIIQKLHRRVFLDKITRDEITLYLSFYVEAANRDAFMAVKQDLMLAFVDCVERNGAKLARSRVQLEVLPTLVPPPPPGAGAPGDTAGGPVVDVPLLPPGSSTVDVPAGMEPVQPPSGSSGEGGNGEGGGGSGGGGGGGSTQQQEGAGTAPASNIVPTTSGSSSSGSPSSSGGGGGSSSGGMSGASKPAAGSGGSSSPSSSGAAAGSPAPAPQGAAAGAAAAASQQAAAATKQLLNDPGAMEQLLRQMVMPDRVVQNVQEGSQMLASYEDLPGPASA